MLEQDLENTIVAVHGPGSCLAENLLSGHLIAYHDPMFEVTTGKHEILMKLLQARDEVIVYYTHVPYAYPIPDGIKDNVKKSLEKTLDKKIKNISFINVAVEAHKKDLPFRLGLEKI